MLQRSYCIIIRFQGEWPNWPMNLGSFTISISPAVTDPVLVTKIERYWKTCPTGWAYNAKDLVDQTTPSIARLLALIRRNSSASGLNCPSCSKPLLLVQRRDVENVIGGRLHCDDCKKKRDARLIRFTEAGRVANALRLDLIGKALKAYSDISGDSLNLPELSNASGTTADMRDAVDALFRALVNRIEDAAPLHAALRTLVLGLHEDSEAISALLSDEDAAVRLLRLSILSIDLNGRHLARCATDMPELGSRINWLARGHSGATHYLNPETWLPILQNIDEQTSYQCGDSVDLWGMLWRAYCKTYPHVLARPFSPSTDFYLGRARELRSFELFRSLPPDWQARLILAAFLDQSEESSNFMTMAWKTGLLHDFNIRNSLEHWGKLEVVSHRLRARLLGNEACGSLATLSLSKSHFGRSMEDYLMFYWSATKLDAAGALALCGMSMDEFDSTVAQRASEALSIRKIVYTRDSGELSAFPFIYDRPIPEALAALDDYLETEFEWNFPESESICENRLEIVKMFRKAGVEEALVLPRTFLRARS